MPTDTDPTDDNSPDSVRLSGAAVEAAARSARARVTYRYLSPNDPGHPLVGGGFWGDFMRSLEGRWEQVKQAGDDSPATDDQTEAASTPTQASAAESQALLTGGSEWG